MRLFTGIKAASMAFLLGMLVVAVDLAEPAVALSSQGTLVARSARRRLGFRVGVRASRHRIGGFSRSGACGNHQVLTALIPPPQSQEGVSQEKAAVDKTASGHPTFFFNLPALSPTTAQFTLQDESGAKQLYNVKFDLTGQPGIVGVALPDSAPPLQVGQKYLWQVSVACDPDDTTSNIIVGSWVERVQVANTASGDKVAALAEQGIWQDTVAVLAWQRYRQPNDEAAAEDWASLMEDAGLPQFKQVAIVQIVKN
ncbi:MAG: DUF928 domain-containing protein [Scytolyngbya sp. HA4215-MV1]|jgi:hypothetical protein|nr:DUF928 domain-containing protein [Scytolyngbya sp. HA4215-MV1]